MPAYAYIGYFHGVTAHKTVPRTGDVHSEDAPAIAIGTTNLVLHAENQRIRADCFKQPWGSASGLKHLVYKKGL